MSESMTIEQLFQEMGNYVAATSPPFGVEAGWRRLQRAIEAEQARLIERRVDVIAAGRERWGRGYTIVFDDDGTWVSAQDGAGRPVPMEDWAAFRAYHEAESAQKFAMIDSMSPW